MTTLLHVQHTCTHADTHTHTHCSGCSRTRQPHPPTTPDLPLNSLFIRLSIQDEIGANFFFCACVSWTQLHCEYLCVCVFGRPPGWWCAVITHSLNSCHVTAVCSSLCPPLSVLLLLFTCLNSPLPPQVAQHPPSLFKLQCGGCCSQRGVLHACPVFLVAPLLAAQRRRWGGSAHTHPLPSSRLWSFCSVNPHCLSVLFD